MALDKSVTKWKARCSAVPLIVDGPNVPQEYFLSDAYDQWLTKKMHPWIWERTGLKMDLHSQRRQQGYPEVIMLFKGLVSVVTFGANCERCHLPAERDLLTQHCIKVLIMYFKKSMHGTGKKVWQNNAESSLTFLTKKYLKGKSKAVIHKVLKLAYFPLS